jgi:hypothetical protein
MPQRTLTLPGEPPHPGSGLHVITSYLLLSRDNPCRSSAVSGPIGAHCLEPIRPRNRSRLRIDGSMGFGACSDSSVS